MTEPTLDELRMAVYEANRDWAQTSREQKEYAAALDALIAAARAAGRIAGLREGDNLMHLIVFRGPSQTTAAHDLLHEHITEAEAESHEG